MNELNLQTAFRAAGQGNVFSFWDVLTADERRSLLAQAAEIDLAEIDRLNRTLVLPSGSSTVDLTELAPAPYEKLPEHGGDAGDWRRAQGVGEEALRHGRVAAFTVAGGQGTRLGYDGPKGTFQVTPVKQKSLFQVFAEKIAAAGRRYGRPLHWFIMTSQSNHAATEAFFAERQHFGLDRSRIHFLRQGRLPAVDFTGRIMLAGKADIALSPDGHGGSFRALHRHGAFDLMQSEGIDLISYFQVDNPLARSIDPAFLGWHLLRNSEMSSKMVPKAYPEERLGHFCVQRGRLVIVEYSDLPLALQREIDPATSQLRYLAGSIAIHVIDREFARRMATGGEGAALPFHRADKKVSTVDTAGRLVQPEKANGVKFEMFIFDALPFARNPIVIETRRADEFSPVKNAEGVDSPRTAREDQLRQFARWLAGQGVPIDTDATGLPRLSVEVSPLFGFDEDTFAESWKRLSPKPSVTDGIYLSPSS
ncbi:MAG: UTP--glucose-1-phosphate uridylyltransferase [Opitutaceae bacterium]|nr:UTP--glucose-1-phosphate uridylyltransferase [Opitutaceae bacterium]